MKMMVNNTWKCDDFLVVSVEQDGMVSQGCYLKKQGRKSIMRGLRFFGALRDIACLQV